MILLFLFLVLVSAAVASVTFFLSRRKSLPPHPQESFDSPPTYRSLFAPDEEELRRWQKEEEQKTQHETRTELRKDLLDRAGTSDLNSLLEAKVFGDSRLYDEVFQILQGIDAERLTDFVTRNGLPIDPNLVELSAKKLKENPSLDNLVKFVHLSALSNSADIFTKAIETTQKLWNEKRLTGISGKKLLEILDSHYWLLASNARISGAGQILKEKLTSMHREVLESNHEK